ncbi:EH signature domain-containing protein [Salinisphaera sp. LB1]|uniref:EH signature domain-containing protein n=1 Tax=Salinisphaera sp. LB1 TaxID=2183911 RepID=UPI000D705A0F|nr:EH signature domain-containing protein [Salinisphaera sp. LB1]AWN14249.1 hypothetical protein SALB1_0042 [Salinisphaera sp. LB1]
MSDAAFRPALKRALQLMEWPAIFAQPRQPKRLEAAQAAIKRQLGDVTPRQPNQYDLLETYRTLASLDKDKPDIRGLARRHVRRAPWVLFRKWSEGESPLALRKRLLSAYYDYLARSGSDRTIGALVHVFLRDHPTDAGVQESTRQLLNSELAQRKSPRLQRLRERCAAYSLLEADGPTRFATMLDAATATGSEDLLADAGLIGDLGLQGFIVAAAERWLDQISDTLESRAATYDGAPYIERVFAFFRSTDNRDALRFPPLRARLADALLLPFVSNNPPKSIQNKLQHFLIDTLGDPRPRPGQWHGVDPAAKAVLLRWLVHTTLKDFFRIVSDASQHDANADRMWPYRNAFWSAYLNKGVIENAWVVLGSEVRKTAQTRLSQIDRGSYGELMSGGGAQPSHAVLIMQIGDLVITEWSHSGKYRIWHLDSPNAPPFYRRSYSRGRLVREPELDGSHHHAEGGSWQRRLADEIRDWTGITVTQREFMPRD